MTISQAPTHSHYDAIVVGARCAGAATAMLLAQRGLRVLAFDRAPYGSDTLSTHALMRPAVLQLARWGLLERLRAAGTPPTHLTVFQYGSQQVEVAIKPRDGVDALYAPRRTLLDRTLVDAARGAGAEVCHGVQLVGLARDDRGRVRGARVRLPDGRHLVIGASIVIGADGRHSAVARMAGARTYRTGRHAGGTIFGYFAELQLDGPRHNRWVFRRGVSGGCIPTDDGLTLVFVSGAAGAMRAALRHDPAHALRAGAERACPELIAPLRDARQVGRLRGFGGQPGHLREAVGRGWALVGDAGYFKDPVTAHGISDALRDAELLANAVAAGNDHALIDYHRTRDRMSLRLFETTDELAGYQWSLQRAAALHRDLSREMRAECDALVALDAPPHPPEVRPAILAAG
jgi:2-polyprenyl-6-methoxyphenol hydroxylase-like FAD-dependent oxidoreductase